MLHHGSKSYPEALDEAARHFHDMLMTQIEEGRASTAAVLQRIQEEVPRDRLVTSNKMRFERDGSRITLLVPRAEGEPLHPFALHQLVERLGNPLTVSKFVERGDKGLDLLAESLQRLYHIDEAKKLLVRSVGEARPEIRGVLSDRFRRLDNRPIIDAFVGAADRIGAVPIEGVGGTTRVAIKAVLPKVFRVGDEVFAMGVAVSNSDFGNGKLSVRTYILRIWCTNFATLEEALGEVHLGKRLNEQNFKFSDKTYQLDTQTMASAVSDVMETTLGPDKVRQTIDLIERATADKVDPKAVFANLQKELGLTKTEVERTREVFNDGGVEQLPPGNTRYRMSNALSWIAKSAPTPERKLELEQAAGKLLLAKKSTTSPAEA